MSAAQTGKATPTLYRGIVKQVISGDCLVIRSGVQKDGKFLEKQIMLSHIQAPRLATKRGPMGAETYEPDQPFAFEAREFLRKKVIGKEVCFLSEAKTQSNTDIGQLYLGKDVTSENVNEALIEAGVVEVRRYKASEEENRLVALEDAAKSKGIGKFTKDSTGIRDIKWTVDNPVKFVDSFKYKPVDAIIEYVKDGSTVRALLLPSFHVVTVQLSGLRCSGFKRVGDKEVAEPFAEEAKLLVESRILHRDIKIILEGVSSSNSSKKDTEFKGNNILLGTILHPNGNISEFLLRDGLAKCVDWSMGQVTQGAEKYRNAEKLAKQQRLRLWKDFAGNVATSDEAIKTLTGKVIEIGNGDNLTIKTSEGAYKKIYLSSLRPLRLTDLKEGVNVQKADKKNVPLYDVPYLFDAREFLRKKLIGKKINATVDFIQPKSDDYPEKVCCTIMFGDINVAEALISNGLAKVLRHRQDDNQRSSKYDDLLSAESRAEKKAAGIHSSKEPTTMKLADASGDANKAKQFLPSLQRGGRVDALVEFVASGSRFRVYLAKDTCLATLLLGGIDCPRVARTNGPNNASVAGDEYGEEAYLFSKERVMHREVKVEFDGVDKAGNFIGWVFLEDGTNLAVALVEAGYAAVHKVAERTSYFPQLTSAEKSAKDRKINRWNNYVEEVKAPEEVEKSEPKERSVNYKKIVITEVTKELHFYAQIVENGPKLEKLTNELRAELEARPPVAGAYTPKVGDSCVAKFSADNEWYRAKVTKVEGAKVHVLYIDYGNAETTVPTKLAQLPAGFSALPAQAHEYALALVQLPKDEDYAEAAVDQLKSEILNDAEYLTNNEYKDGPVDYVTLYNQDKEDIGKLLIANGHALCEKRRDRRLHKLVTEYLKAQDSAKESRANIWRYGDITEDDANEFGVKK